MENNKLQLLTRLPVCQLYTGNVALPLFHIIILNTQIYNVRKYGNVYRAIISTNAQIISDYKVNVHCSLLTHTNDPSQSDVF